MIAFDSKQKPFLASAFLILALLISVAWGILLGRSFILALALVAVGVYCLILFFRPFYVTVAFLLTVPLGPFLNIPITEGGFLLSLVFAFTGLLAWVFKAMVHKDADLLDLPTKKPVYILMLAFLLAMMLSLLNTANLTISLAQIKRFAYYIAVYFFVTYTVKDESRLKAGLTALMVGYFFVAFLGIHEAITGKNIYEMFGDRSLLGSHLPPAVLRLHETRLNGVAGSPEGHNLSMISFFLLLLCPLFFYRSKLIKTLLIFLLVLALVNIVGTAFRGAVFMLIAALSVFLFLGRVPHKWLALTGGVLLIMVVSLWGYVVFPKLDVERLTATSETELRTVGLRKRNTIIGLEMALDQPVIGHGPDGFVLQYTRYAHLIPEARSEEIKVHNTYVQVLAEEGIVGLSIFLLMLIITLKRIVRLVRRTAGLHHYLLLSLLIVFIAHMVMMAGSNLLFSLNFWSIFALAGSAERIFGDDVFAREDL